MLYKIYLFIWGVSFFIFNAASCVSGHTGNFNKYGSEFILGIVSINVILLIQLLFSIWLIKDTRFAKKNDFSAAPYVTVASTVPLAIMLCGVIFMIIDSLNVIFGILASLIFLILGIIISLKKSNKQKDLKNALANLWSKKSVKFVAAPLIALIILASVLFFSLFQPIFRYNKALSLVESGNSSKAAYLFSTTNYSDSKAQLSALLNLHPSLSLVTANVGDTVTFGQYEQDNDLENGKEPIEWLVIEEKGSKILLLSKKCLDTVTYNEEFKDVTWEVCTLRTWLNDDFYNTAFNDFEKSFINTTKLYNKKNLSYYGTTGGNSTKDNVFILSFYEADFYLAKSGNLSAQSTPYAISQGAYRNASSLKSWWWYRTPGYANNYTAHAPIAEDRDPSKMGIQVTKSNIAVRPAIWIELNK